MSHLDLSPRLPESSAHTGQPEGLSRTAVATAILLHLALILWLLLDPRFDAPVIPKPPIPVTLVMVAPPPPPPPPLPAPKPAPPKPPPPMSYRESGPDQRTTAPAPAAEPAPEPAAPPVPPTPTPAEPTPPAPAAAAAVETPPMPESPTATAPPEAKPDVKPKPRPTVAPAEPRKEAAIPRAPQTHTLLNREPAEREESGDPYLNLVWQRIEQNRQPTTPIGSSGLHLEGLATYQLVIDRGGRMHEINLLFSSGAPQLDEEVRRMIIAATPFPPLPPGYPDPLAIKVTIRLFPR